MYTALTYYVLLYNRQQTLELQAITLHTHTRNVWQSSGFEMMDDHKKGVGKYNFKCGFDVQKMYLKNQITKPSIIPRLGSIG